MPRFISNGPLVPDELVRALDEDKVVLFCGAGVSMGAGQLDFNGLVGYAYDRLAQTRPPKTIAGSEMPLDQLLRKLEVDSTEGAMRATLARRLLEPPASLDLHEALLGLATINRGTGFRLVTTNFDRYFHLAAEKLGIEPQWHEAPALPVPRIDRHHSWNSVVFLHGLVREPAEENHHLVLTSADFGTAYLTEGWAARFVQRLFDGYSVVFIGYSVNDPAIVYMTDALAAENSNPKRPLVRPASYIFLSHSTGNPTDDEREAWVNRGLEPIFYATPNPADHSQLSSTITRWAEARRDWQGSRLSMIHGVAGDSPKGLGAAAVDNLYWAVGSPDGAKAFARMPEPPSIDWLEEFELRDNAMKAKYEERLKEAQETGSHLPMEPAHRVGRLMLRPGEQVPGLSLPEGHLLEWLGRHLDKTALIDWVARRTGRGYMLHPEFRDVVMSKLRNREATQPLDQGRPPLPIGHVRFWTLVTSDLVGTLDYDFRDPLFHGADFNGDQDLRRTNFLSSIRPKISLSERPAGGGVWSEILAGSDGVVQPRERRLHNLVRAKVVLERERELDGHRWHEGDHGPFFSSMVDELTIRLKEALDLWALLDPDRSDTDPADLDRPSIQPHAQNRYRSNGSWTLLIDALWNGWCHLNSNDQDAGHAVITQWLRYPHRTFRRFALAAMAVGSYPAEAALDVLANGTGAYSFWHSYMIKEAVDLMAALMPRLGDEDRDRLLALVIAGPPEIDDPSDRFTAAQIVSIREREIYDRLHYLLRAGHGSLPEQAAAELVRLQAAHSSWEPSEADRARFSSYHWSHGGIVHNGLGPTEMVGMSEEALATYLRASAGDYDDRLQQWRTMATQEPSKALGVLRWIASNPTDNDRAIWRFGIFGLSVGPNRSGSLGTLIELLGTVPSDTKAPLIFAFCEFFMGDHWRSAADLGIERFARLWTDLLTALLTVDASVLRTDAETDAEKIRGKEVALLAEGMLDALHAIGLEANDGLPDAGKAWFNLLLSREPLALRQGRQKLATRLHYLHAVDPAWTVAALVQRMDWQDEEEAQAIWEGYASRPGVDDKLWTQIRAPFFATFQSARLASLGAEASKALSSLLMVVGICVPPDDVPADPSRAAINLMSNEDRIAAARWLYEYMAHPANESECTTRARRWHEKVHPWLQKAWPQTKKLLSQGTAENFGLLALMTEDAFPEAMQFLQTFLVPLDSPGSIIVNLAQSNHPETHPVQSLDLMDRLIGERSLALTAWRLKDVLDRLRQASPSIEGDSRFRRFSDALKLLAH